jgi:hypothetical protein
MSDTENPGMPGDDQIYFPVVAERGRIYRLIRVDLHGAYSKVRVIKTTPSGQREHDLHRRLPDPDPDPAGPGSATSFEQRSPYVDYVR